MLGGVLFVWDSVDGLFLDGMIDVMFGVYVVFV